MAKSHLQFQSFIVPFHWFRNSESHPIWPEVQSTIKMLRDLECHSTCSTAMGAKQYAILIFIVRSQIYTLLIKKRRRIIFRTGRTKTRVWLCDRLEFYFGLFLNSSIYLITAFLRQILFSFSYIKGQRDPVLQDFWKFSCSFVNRVSRILPFIFRLKKKLNILWNFSLQKKYKATDNFQIISKFFYITSFNHFCR
jgi:hypothetical protein